MAINDMIGQQAPAGAPVEAPVGPAAQAPEGQDPNAATPEEQQAYEKVVLAGVKALSDEKTNPKIMSMLSQGGDPAQAIADATTTIFGTLDEQSGGTIPVVVVQDAAGEILQNVAEFAKESGTIPVDQTMQQKATQLMLINLHDMGYEVDPDSVGDMGEGMTQGDLDSLVSEQDAVARSGGDPQAEQTAPAAAPQAPAPQQLPGIINQTIGA